MSQAREDKNQEIGGGEVYLLGVDEFYNVWSETFYFRLMVDVRKKERFLLNHASTAIHYDPSKGV
jgi:hypothetical protein